MCRAAGIRRPHGARRRASHRRGRVRRRGVRVAAEQGQGGGLRRARLRDQQRGLLSGHRGGRDAERDGFRGAAQTDRRVRRGRAARVLGLRQRRLVAAGGKIIIISSQAGSTDWRFTQCPDGGNYGHHMSRAACNIGGVLLSQELKAKAIPVAMLHPGFNRTGMTRKPPIFGTSRAPGPRRRMRVLPVPLQVDMESTGKFINCGTRLRSRGRVQALRTRPRAVLGASLSRRHTTRGGPAPGATERARPRRPSRPTRGSSRAWRARRRPARDCTRPR